MRLPLERRESDCLKPIYSDKLTGEETIETVIPDTCGDAGRILDVRGQALIQSKTSGGGLVRLTGEIAADVVMHGEDGETVFCVPVKLPFEFSSQVPEADEDCLITASIDPPKLEARLLNPRKMLIRAKISAFISCWRRETLTLWDGKEDDASQICLLKKDVVCCTVADVTEKSFSVSDEYALSSSDGGSKVLACETAVSVSDVKTVGSKLIFKVTAETQAIILDGDGRLSCRSFETQFSQLIESACASEEPQVYITPYLMAADHILLTDRDDAVLAANLRLCVQAVCLVRRQQSYIADAYSNLYPLQTQRESFEALSVEPQQHQKLRMKGELDSDDCQILYLLCDGVNHRREGDKDFFPAIIKGVGLKDEGELVPIELTLKGYGEPSSAGDIRVVSGLSWSTPTVEQGRTVCLEISYEETVGSKQTLDALCSIEADTEKLMDRDGLPSFTILCAPGGQLWDIAKKYGSTTSAIAAANSIQGEFDPDARPIIIPKV